MRNIYYETAEWIVDKMIHSGVIASEDRPIYLHGAEMGIAMLSWMAMLMILGLLIGMPLEAAILLVVLMTLRSYAGGFHAASHLACFLLSNACIVFILPVRITPVQWQPLIGAVLLSVSLAVIWRFAPVETPNRQYEPIEVTHYRKRARIIAGIEAGVAALFGFIGMTSIFYSICLSIFAVAASMAAGLLLNRKAAKTSKASI